MNKAKIKPLLALAFFEFEDLYYIILNSNRPIIPIEIALRNIASEIPLRHGCSPILWVKLKRNIILDLENYWTEKIKGEYTINTPSSDMISFCGHENSKIKLAQGAWNYLGNLKIDYLKKMQLRTKILKYLIDGKPTNDPRFKSLVQKAKLVLGKEDVRFLQVGFIPKTIYKMRLVKDRTFEFELQQSEDDYLSEDEDNL
jgi:hypothetical protein